jgi:predicted transcriptional regulator
MKRKDKVPGKLRVVEALKDQPKGYKQLWIETGLRGNLLSKYLKELQREENVERDIETRKYQLTQKGLNALQTLSNARFLELHPPMFFHHSLGIQGPPVEGISVGPMEVDFAYSASLTYDRPIGKLTEIFQKRGKYAPALFLTQLLQLACERRLLNRRTLEGGRIPRLSARKWRAIFKALCPRAHELIWLERIDLRDLLRVLTHPKGLEAASGIAVAIDPSSLRPPVPRVERRTSTLEV